MKLLTATLATCLLLTFASDSVFAQSRSRRANSAPRRRAPASPSARLDSTQTNSARIRLADQIKNLSRFLYLYGRISKDFELTGAQAETSEATERTRAGLIDNFSNIRVGLEQLEDQFSTNPGLQPHYRRLAGVARRAEDAESRARANQLDQAGRMLVEVVNQLTDVLLEM